MTVVFPILLGGLALAAIPVLLHLIMRQKPRRLSFPAFRFLVQRQRTNLRKLRFRHLLLLALRVLLIAAICLALTRPRLFHQGLGLSSERPVAAVLVFDTSPSMDYKTSDGVTRLDEAKKRGLDLLEELPEGSRIVVLDSASTAQSLRGDWVSHSAARERIGALKISSMAGSLTAALEHAYRLLADIARNREDENSRFLPRFVCVFSDRTRAAWDTGRQKSVFESSDLVPPALEGLQLARESSPLLMGLLKELREKLPPPPAQDYPEQVLLDGLTQLRERVSSLSKDDMPADESLTGLVQNIQRRGRELLALIQPRTENDEYRDKLMHGLQDILTQLRGAQGLLLDVGLDNPIDLALVQLDLPKLPDGNARQLFAEDEKILIHAVVRATGKDFDMTLQCKLRHKTLSQSVQIAAGTTKTIPFEIDLAEFKLEPGHHQLEARFKTPDLLQFNNQRFLTFAVREVQRVLVLADDVKNADYFVRALKALRYGVEVKNSVDGPKTDLSRYRAVFLFQAASPDETLWNQLERFVKKGGGLGIVPGGSEMKMHAYHTDAAKSLMPGTFGGPIAHGKDGTKPGAAWNLDDDSIYQHPLLAPFRQYKGNKSIDFVYRPCSAFQFWNVAPHKDEGSVLVRYTDLKKSPALLERQANRDNPQGGKVILFTTPLDARTPRWNDYLEDDRSFYVASLGICSSYLTGQSDALKCNFLVGQGDPFVMLAPSQRFAAYSLQGPGVIEQIPEPEGNRLIARQATSPGNYVVDGVGREAKGNSRVAAFSVNLPGEESDLTRVPAEEIEAVFGPGSVVPIERNVDIQAALKGHWSEPVELFPFLMVLLLFVLAVENLLANKFYRRETEVDEHGGG